MRMASGLALFVIYCAVVMTLPIGLIFALGYNEMTREGLKLLLNGIL